MTVGAARSTTDRRRKPALFLVVCLAAARASELLAAVPPVPVPPENPITEEKRVLGKILFWDEQLSSNDTVACGTCHRPAFGGADPRRGLYPGTDPGTIDDVIGSPGIASLDRTGHTRADPVFGIGPRVGTRQSPSNFGAIWADELFWDGRARSELRDPLTGNVVIPAGAALESQALEPLLNDAEMARAGREWADVTQKLARTKPLALAAKWPADVTAAIRARPSYPALFAAAFGDPAITPVRIAFALASYERTLVADETAWDRFEAGDASALSQTARYGWQAMQTLHCTGCHVPPLFTSNEFFNIGLRRSDFDEGRRAVTGDPEDAGEMKVPSLRNVALRPRFMHTGEFGTLAAAINFYEAGRSEVIGLPDRDVIPGFGTYTFGMGALTRSDIEAFLREGLTDPRARDETFPFDRPTLGSEREPRP